MRPPPTKDGGAACDIRGCKKPVKAGGFWDGTYVSMCRLHSEDLRHKLPRPLLTRYCLERTLLRDKRTGIVRAGADEALAAKAAAWKASKLK